MKIKLSKTTILNILFVLLCCSLIHQFIKQLFFIYGYNSYGISEYLTNYQGGFVRRGLLGEILFFFANRFSFDVEWAIKIICAIFFIVVVAFFVKSFLKKGYSLYLLPLCFFFGGMITGNYFNFWIRKDFVMLTFFIAILLIFNRQNIILWIKAVFINVLAIFIILNHESFAFFSLPVLFFLFFNSFENKKLVSSFSLAALCLLPSILTFLLVCITHGNQATAQAIWDSWQILSFGKTSDVPLGCSIGAIGWNTFDTVKLLSSINFITIDNRIISIFVWIVTFPVIYYIVTNTLFVFRKTPDNFTEKHKTVLSTIILFQFICLLPLFLFLSCDYGRVIFYLIASSFAVFLIFPADILAKNIPLVILQKVEKFNNAFPKANKTIIAILMLVTGFSPVFFNIEFAYKSTMLYQVLNFI
ncbi:MAG: hypothetical protein LBH32_05020 [Dysgonamonadaceae bacterium]|jgi:hypothetical protein|nr:hypothetical protein [Dysgonamonadaceae bacterium]